MKIELNPETGVVTISTEKEFVESLNEVIMKAHAVVVDMEEMTKREKAKIANYAMAKLQQDELNAKKKQTDEHADHANADPDGKDGC